MASAGPGDDNTCDFCSEVHRYTCMTCGDKMCTRCKTIHDKSNATRDHEVVSDEEVKSFQRGKSSFCNIHPAERGCMFCRDCRRVYCAVCMDAHSGHSVSDVETVAEEKRTALAKQIEAMRAQHDELARNLMEVEELRRGYLQGVQDVEDQMTRRADHLCRQVNRALQRTLANVEQTRQVETAKAENQENLFHSQCERLNEVTRVYKEEIEKDDPESMMNFMMNKPDIEEFSSIPEVEPLSVPTYSPVPIDTEAIRRCFGELSLPGNNDEDQETHDNTQGDK